VVIDAKLDREYHRSILTIVIRMGLAPLDVRTWLNGTCIGYGSFSIALHSVLDGIQKDSSSFGKDQAFDNSVQEHRIGDIHYF
jgi:hypothetical protein